MADFKITRGGTLPNRYIEPPELPDGVTISSVTEVSATTGLTITGEAANSGTITLDDATTRAAGKVIEFTIACALNAPTSQRVPHQVVFSYTTSAGATLRVGATIEVVTHLS